MKRVLEIDAEVEKHLVAAFDAALKSGGMQVLQSIDFLRNSIKQQEDKAPDGPK